MKIICNYILLLSIFFVVPSINAQSDRPINNNEQRLSDFTYHLSGNFYSAARFMKIPSLSPDDDWTAPDVKFYLDGVPLSTMPFNFNTADLIPVDILQTKSTKQSDSLDNDGVFIYSRPIEKSFRVFFRAFTGSETGDPLIYSFTRPGNEVTNKNKIVPSGAVSIENTNGKFSYRFTAGYFGYFATNWLKNAAVIYKLDRTLSDKQNRQMSASGELKYSFNDDKQLLISASYINYYGWDIAPFITSFAHLESGLHLIRARYIDSTNNFSISFSNDGNTSEIANIRNIPGSKFTYDNYSIMPGKSFLLDKKLTLKTSLLAGIQKIKNISTGNNSHQNFFTENKSKYYFTLSNDFEYKPSNRFVFMLTSGFEKGINNDYTLSGKLLPAYWINNYNKIGISVSSQTRLPNVNELYGNFVTIRNANSLPDTFKIQGNDRLKPERKNQLGLFYCYNNLTNFSFRGDLKFNITTNPIVQYISKESDINEIGDLVRSAVFRNKLQEKYYAVNLSSSYSHEYFFLELYYQYLNNNEIKFSPKNSIVFNSKIVLPFNATINLKLIAYSKRVFEQEVTKDFNSERVSTIIPHSSSLDVAYLQKLTEFYFFHDIELKLVIENIFNSNVVYHPYGNRFYRTVLFFISGRI